MTARRAIFEWTRTVMRDPQLSGAAKTVAWCLAEHASANACAWPKVEAVALSIAIDERNVRKHVSALATGGYLVIEDRRHLREPSWYWLAVDGALVGDFSKPPKPRSTGRNHPVENTCTADETIQSSDLTEASSRDEVRPDGSIRFDRADSSVSTGRNHPVPPIYIPQGSAQGSAQSAGARESNAGSSPAGIVESALVSALGAVGARLSLRTGDAAHFGDAAAAMKLTDSRPLRDVAAEWCPDFVAEYRYRTPKNLAEYAQSRAANGGAKVISFARGKPSGWQAPAEASQFVATEITADLFKREALDG